MLHWLVLIHKIANTLSNATFASNCDDLIPLLFVKYNYVENRYETNYIAPTIYATQNRWCTI